ncbi:MAG: 4a-hydroxytetrahydrobiopterin dehydratase [Mycobacteriales bacterium]
MPLLDEVAVTNALTSLNGWTGDTGRIARSVLAPAERAERLRIEVMGVADDVDHHPLVEHHGDALTFILWSHSAGGVTEKDIDLARRIDDIVDGDTQPQSPSPAGT